MYTIGIVGAGPVGLTFARLLLTSTTSSQITVKVFEKDVSHHSRHSLGGSLDLHPPTGLAAMRKMNLWDAFTRYARWEGEEIRICDQNGTCYIHQIDAPQVKGFDARPEIDRVRLMEILLESVPDDVVHWGKQLIEVIQRDGRWILRFEDGSEEGPFDLIAGADGAWSKVRKVLTDVRPQYSGISGITGAVTSKSAGKDWDRVQNMIGNGSNFSFSYNRGMMGQRQGDGSLKVSFYQRREQSWINEIKEKYGNDDDAMKRILYEEYKEWVPDYQRWIKAAEHLWSTPLWELPYGDTFKHQPGITLIGDAAHLQTPFAGEGLNAGMRDALDLCAAIEKALTENQDMDNAIKEFEQVMFVHAEGVMTRTLANKNSMYSQDAPYPFFASLAGQIAKELGHDIHKGFLSFLPVTKTIYGLCWLWGSIGAVRRHARDRLRKQQKA